MGFFHFLALPISYKNFKLNRFYRTRECCLRIKLIYAKVLFVLSIIHFNETTL